MHISFAGTTLHKLFVEKNEYVEREYENYIRVNSEGSKRKRLMEWLFLMRVNLAYLILNRNSKKHPLNNEVRGKLPYLDGPESESYIRPREIHFAHSLLKYDVVSFDVFDTLVLRPFAKPSDLFIVVGNRLGILDFADIRINAEKRAREIAKVKKGNTEVTIYDIYEQVRRKTGIDIQYGVETELNTELDFCLANPYMKHVWRIVRNQEKRIIVTSDMYLTGDMIKKILDKCGYFGYENVYVSCDWDCSKREGGLYKAIKHDIGKGCSIVHVGDNQVVDKDSAIKNGIESRLYLNCHELGNKYRPDDMSALVGSFYSGIVNIHLHNGLNTFDPYYEYGFIYGGLYVVGFCSWIHEKAIEKGVKKILFLSRDGYIYQKVFDLFFDDVPSEYVYWSRIANIKYAIETQRNNFLKNIAEYKATGVVPVTYEEVLASVSLSGLVTKLKEYGIRYQSILTPQNIKRFEDFLIDNWGYILEEYNRQSEKAKDYFEGIVSGCDVVAAVDVGWRGTGPLGIKYLIEDKWKFDCTVEALVAGSLTVERAANVNEIMNGKLEAYMFSRTTNTDLLDNHLKTNKNTNCIYFELFSQAQAPSFSGWDSEGEMLFDIPEVENYEMINKIHDGIMDFASRYKDFSDKDTYLRMISGRDAYIPFSMIIRNLTYIKKYFKGFSFARNISGSINEQSIETIEEIMIKTGI